MEEADFGELCPIFSPMMHVICLIFSTSKHYGSPARIIVLVQARILPQEQKRILFNLVFVQEICNLLIEQACRYIDPSTIFTIEVKILFPSFLPDLVIVYIQTFIGSNRGWLSSKFW